MSIINGGDWKMGDEDKDPYDMALTFVRVINMTTIPPQMCTNDAIDINESDLTKPTAKAAKLISILNRN